MILSIQAEKHMMLCGCDACNGTGYYDRIGIFEILVVEDEIKDIIAGDGSAIEIKNKALEQGYRPLVVDAVKKVIDGITTLEEIDNNLVIY